MGDAGRAFSTVGAALLSGVLSIESLFSVAEPGAVTRMAPGGSEWARQQCVLGGFFLFMQSHFKPSSRVSVTEAFLGISSASRRLASGVRLRDARRQLNDLSVPSWSRLG